MAEKITDFRDRFKNVDDYYKNFKENKPHSLTPQRRHFTDRSGSRKIPTTNSSISPLVKQPYQARLNRENVIKPSGSLIPSRPKTPSSQNRINSKKPLQNSSLNSFPEIKIQSQPRPGKFIFKSIF